MSNIHQMNANNTACLTCGAKRCQVCGFLTTVLRGRLCHECYLVVSHSDHHPSCSAIDEEIVWKCTQCGATSSAEYIFRRTNECLEKGSDTK